MSTDIQLCSRALVMIGANPITALDGSDTSTEATVAIQIYETAVKDLLSRSRWRFAAKQALLSPTTGTALTRWDATFDLPAGVLVIHALTLGGKRVEFDRYGDQIGAACLTTDAPVIDYGYRVAESLWPSYFDSYVELHLAAIFAYSVANQLDLSDFLEKKAARAFAFAKNQDGQGRTTKKLETSRFLQVRGFSTGADDGYSGSSAGGGGDVGIVLAGVRDGSLPGIDTPIPIANGGTGANTAAGARTNLGLGTIATQAASAVAITGGTITGITNLTATGGSITGITDLAVADGGTGASTASDARTNLGLGTISTQAASAVAITGGSINGTTIGATTRSTGAFTTLAANSTTTFTGGLGAVGIGSTSATSFLYLGANATGSTTVFGVFAQHAVQTDVTAFYDAFRAGPSVAASAAITNLRGYVFTNPSLGAGASVTTLKAFESAAITSGTTSYAFHASSTSAAGRWNFFAAGNADNAFAGNTRFGGTTVPVATVDVTGSVAATTAIKSTGATSGIGYDTGAGGTVTQITSRSQGVTINKICGNIVTFSKTTTAGTFDRFTVTNSAMAADDVVILNLKSGGNNRYQLLVKDNAAGSFVIEIYNVGAAGTAEALTISYAIIKAVAA